MSEDLIEIRNCNHDIPCVIHTKVKPNSRSFGKSVYTCERRDTCGFKEAAKISLQKCSLHDDYIAFRCFRIEDGNPVIRYYCESHAFNEWCGLQRVTSSEDEDKENLTPKREEPMDIPSSNHDQVIIKESEDSTRMKSSNNCNEQENDLNVEESVQYNEGEESLQYIEGEESVQSDEGEESVQSDEGEESLQSNEEEESVDSAEESVRLNEGEESVLSNEGEESVLSNEGEESVQSNEEEESVDSAEESVRSVKGEESIRLNEREESLQSNEGEESVQSIEGEESVQSNEGEESVQSNEGEESVWSNEGEESVSSTMKNQNNVTKVNESVRSGKESDIEVLDKSPTESDESDSDVVQVLEHNQKEKEFQVGFQFRTLMKQLADIQILIARHGPYLPDKGAKLKADEQLIKQRMLKLRGYIPSQQEIIEHLNKPPASKQSNTEEVQEQSVKQRLHSKAFHGFSKQLTHGAVQNLHSSLDSCPGEDVLEDDPKRLRVSLMKHQKRALTWLLWRERQIPKGGILADDMGLGKTLSMISLILHTMSQPLPDTHKEGLLPVKATLVVVPLTLLGMWENEIKSKVERNTLSVLVYHGPKRTNDHRDFQYYDVVLTTYSLVTNSAAELIAAETRKPLKKGAGCNTIFRVKWRRIILDEAHNIRNHKAGCSIGCCGLDAEYRWAMTGTPIQNKLEDFYSLIKFIRLSPFNDLRVWKDCISSRSTIGMQRLKAMVSSLVLRRTKEDMTRLNVLKLPDKSVVRHDIILDDIEKKIYDIIFHEGREFFKRFLTEQGEYFEEDEGSDNNLTASLMDELPPTVAKAVHKILGFLIRGDEAMEKSSKGRMVLVLLLRLRQACSHLNLLCPAIDQDSEDITDDLDLELAMGAISLNQPTSSRSYQMMGDTPYEFSIQRTSAKIKCIVSELEQILSEPVNDSGLPNKCIIVSQWTSMFNILEHHLMRKDITYTRIDGKVPPKIRQISVDKFNSIYRDPSVMLLSLTAGGVGLTLTGANHVFIVDLHWNPQLEEQAADRCHRVGQTRQVFVHRFIVKDTIEVGIQALQHTKLELARQVLSGQRAKMGLTLADLKQLFEIY